MVLAIVINSMSSARSLSKAVQTQPKDVAVSMVEKTAVDEQVAIELVKYLRNPAMVKNAGRKSEYQRAKDHFSESDDDDGVEWAFRYAAHKANEPGAFARRSRPSSSSVDKLEGSSNANEVEKDAGDVWSESPFSV